MLIDEGIIILERLRVARGYKSQEKFISDVCDARQYRRYLSGASRMPSGIFFSLIERLNMNIEEVLKFYLDTSKKEKKTVQNLYNKLLSDHLDGLDIKLKELNESILIEKTDRMLLRFCTLLFDYKRKKITKYHYVEQVKKLINFDELMSYEIISLYEMIILSNINTELKDSDSILVINKLSEALKTYEITDLDSLDFYLIVLYTVIRIRGSNNQFHHAIELCDIGVKLSSQYHHFYLLSHQYYLKAYYFNKLELNEKRDKEIHLCINTLEISSQDSLVHKIRSLITQEFNVDIHDFEINYWKNNK
jgi:hypothetical protein